MRKIALKRQAQFFQEYRKIYEREGEVDLSNITSLTDHHLMAILFQLRWEILVGLERHFVRKPPGPVVATGSTGHYQNKENLRNDECKSFHNIKSELYLHKNSVFFIVRQNARKFIKF